MKIILESTVKELRNAARVFGIPKKVFAYDRALTVSRKAFRKAVENGTVDLSYKPNTDPERK